MSGAGLSLDADTQAARFAGIPAALKAALGSAFADLAAELQSAIRAKLDGAVVTSHSGRLAASSLRAVSRTTSVRAVAYGNVCERVARE